MSDSSDYAVKHFFPLCSKGLNAFLKVTVVSLARNDFADDFQGIINTMSNLTLADKKALKKVIVSLNLLKQDHKAKVNWSFLQSAVLPAISMSTALEQAEQYVEWGMMNEADYLLVCDVLKKMNETREEFNIKDTDGTVTVSLDYVKMVTFVNSQF